MTHCSAPVYIWEGREEGWTQENSLELLKIRKSIQKKNKKKKNI